MCVCVVSVMDKVMLPIMLFILWCNVDTFLCDTHTHTHHLMFLLYSQVNKSQIGNGYEGLKAFYISAVVEDVQCGHSYPRSRAAKMVL